MRRLRITVDGRVYDVIVEGADVGGAPSAAPLPVPTSVPGPAPVRSSEPIDRSPASSAGAVPCPLAGKIVSISVRKGDRVSAGQQLLTIEAMKMNTSINAPQDGEVREVLVAPGDLVEEGQALVVLG